MRNRFGRVNLVATSERLSDLTVTSPVQRIRGLAACRICEGCNIRVFVHTSVTSSVVQQSNKLLTGHRAVRLKCASLRVRYQPLLLVRHTDVLSERVAIRNILERSLQYLGLSHRDAHSNLMGDFLTSRVGANIQLQGMINTFTLHQLDGELVATAEKETAVILRLFSVFTEVGALSGSICRKLIWGYWRDGIVMLYAEAFRDVEYVDF